MIVDENGDKCSAKDLANEILLRCLENISSYLDENVYTLEKLSDKEDAALNVQLVKQAKRCFKLLGVHEDDIGERYNPDIPWNRNMTNEENWCVDKDGVKIPEAQEADESGVVIPLGVADKSLQDPEFAAAVDEQIEEDQAELAAEDKMDQVPTICKTMEERREQEIEERNDHG